MFCRRLVALAGLAAFAVGCSGAVDSSGAPPPGHPISDSTGFWVFSGVDRAVTLQLDAETATAILRGCPARSGSYTFSDDGTAGFSFPGRSQSECDGDTEELWATLEMVERWDRDGRDFVLTGDGAPLNITLE